MACERGHTHLIVFTHACGYYSRAATISLVELQVRLLFEGGYYSGCGFYSNKYGSPQCSRAEGPRATSSIVCARAELTEGTQAHTRP